MRRLHKETPRLAALAGVLLLGACTAAYKPPHLGGLYDRAAQHHTPDTNPIVVIPGILGSRLEQLETERVVWGAFARGYAKPNEPEGARLIALPIEDAPLSELHDDVVATDVLDRIKIKLLGMPMKLKAYFQILSILGGGGYRDEGLGDAIDYGEDHFTCFQFPYDWRRDNVENARRFHEFILEKRAYVKEEIRNRWGVVKEDIKFDIVAHSMGGLLARYYLRYGGADLPTEGELPPITWAGSEHVERVVLIGPPNGGSFQSLIDLVEGRKFGFTLPRYPAALLGTFPSIYQLLPRSRHHALVWADNPDEPVPDILSPELWQRMEWGLASPEQDRVLAQLLPDVLDPSERRRVALAYQRRCLLRARRFLAALDRPGAPPPGVQLFLIAGDAVPTSETAAVDRTTGRLRVIREGPGDGAVLRRSALMDERQDETWSPTLVSPIVWQSTMFLFSDHLGMTKDPMFSDNVLYWLLMDPR